MHTYNASIAKIHQSQFQIPLKFNQMAKIV